MAWLIRPKRVKYKSTKLWKEEIVKLLVVDDSSTMRRIIKNTLTRLGHDDVLEAEHGVEAWDLLTKNEDVKVLITDWNMPEMNGLELVKK